MEVTVDLIKALREKTGAGIMDTKKALEEADGDLDKAQALLREKGLATAAKKADRATLEGLVESYIHSGGRIGALVEVNCETDFVARTDGFKALAHDLAMQVAAMNPRYLDSPDVPEDDDSTPQESCLLEQPFIRDPSLTVRDRVNETISQVGENVRIRRFSRFSLGE